MQEFLENRRNIHSLQLAGLTVISLLILQAMLSLGQLDTGATISFVALAVAIPALVFGTLNALALGSSAHVTWSYIAVRAIGMFGALVGVEAALWRISWMAGGAFLISGGIGLICHLRYQHSLEKIFLAKGGQNEQETVISSQKR